MPASPLRIWIGGALAAFVDGFIDGFPIGASGGAGIAVADGKFAQDLNLGHLAITAAHILAIPVCTGVSDVRSWKKDKPFPNIFAATPEPPPAPRGPTFNGAPSSPSPQ